MVGSIDLHRFLPTVHRLLCKSSPGECSMDTLFFLEMSQSYFFEQCTTQLHQLLTPRTLHAISSEMWGMYYHPPDQPGSHSIFGLIKRMWLKAQLSCPMCTPFHLTLQPTPLSRQSREGGTTTRATHLKSEKVTAAPLIRESQLCGMLLYFC